MVPPCRVTLLDVVWAVSKYADTEAELVATVAFLVNSGAVQLCGTFAGARIDLSPAVYATPHSFCNPKGVKAQQS